MARNRLLEAKNAVFRGKIRGPTKRYTGATMALAWRYGDLTDKLTPN